MQCEEKQYVAGRLIFGDDSWENCSPCWPTPGDPAKRVSRAPEILDEQGMGPINSDERDNKMRSYIKQRVSEASSGVFLPSLWFSTYFLILVDHVISTRSERNVSSARPVTGEQINFVPRRPIQLTSRIYYPLLTQMVRQSFVNNGNFPPGVIYRCNGIGNRFETAERYTNDSNDIRFATGENNLSRSVFRLL